MQNQLEWSVLEVDEEEWQQHTYSPDTAAAANGFPVDGDMPQQSGLTRGAAVAAAVLLLLVASLGFGAWHTAEQGINRMEYEVANVIKLDTIQAHSERPEEHEQTKVTTVEFLDGKAMVQAVVTRTLPTGQPLVYLQTQFYALTPHGWQRAAPVLAFWGSSQELDTSHLHFVFHRADRAAVEQLAPELEALYTTLQLVLGQGPMAANDKLMVEIVPTSVALNKAFAAGHLQLTSPLLYDLSYGYTATDLLGRQARYALVGEAMKEAVRVLPIKRKWQPFVDRLRTWLYHSDSLPLAPAAGTNPIPVVAGTPVSLRLANLLDCSSCANPNIVPGVHSSEGSAAIDSLFDFIVATYGLDTLPTLLAGFARYDDWDTLSPAVFGVSADELQTAWQVWVKRRG
jgi:hypothetical protein